MRVTRQENFKPKLDNFWIWAKLNQLTFRLNLKNKILPVTLLLILIISVILTYQVVFDDKFFPKTYIGDTNISFLTGAEAYKMVSAKFSQRTKTPLNFSYKGQSFPIDLATPSANLNFKEVLSRTFTVGHSGSFYNRISDQIKNLFFPTKVAIEGKVSLDDQLSSISSAIFIEPVNAKLVIDESNISTTSAQISIVEGSSGQDLDKERLHGYILYYLNFGFINNSLPIKTIEPAITSSKTLTAKQFLESNASEPIILTFNQDKWTIDTKILLSFINLEKEAILDQDKITSYLKEIVASKIDQNVQEGLFNFDPSTKRVAEFKASQEGRKLNIDKTIELITYSLENSGPKQISLPVDIVKPKIQTGDVNNLGINELIGRGISNFAGSIVNRIYNINLGASKINGILIPPGEVFSFNQIVGDISAATGYRQAYVIKSGRTVLDDGGGICQVSTTLFRTTLNSGLPVLDRTAHAYRVAYYEQGFPVGLDATVFHPTVDFKFKNDTTSHILIQAYTRGNTLYVDFYGTSDGRVVNISKSIMHSQTPPLPEIRQDDPNLPVGTVKQVDWAAWGAKVSFNRTVTRGTETLISETFNSNYRPWQAIYLVGTKVN